MSREFRLSDLQPDPLTFTDDAYGGDGRRYDVLTADLMSEADLAKMARLQRLAAQHFAAERTEEALGVFNDLMALLIPTLPEARIAAIPLTFKTRFLEFWQQQHPAPKVPRGKARTPTPAPRAPRSPRSAPPTE